MNRPAFSTSAQSRSVLKNVMRHPWVVGGMGGFALLGMVTAYAIAPHDNDVPVPVQTFLEQLGTPSATPVASGLNEFLREERIQRSDTIASLLSRMGIDDREALEFINKDAGAKTIARQLRPGKTVTAKTGGDGSLIAFYFPLNGKDSVLAIEKSDKGFVSEERVLHLSKQIQVKSGEITSSLFGATDDAGIPDAVATQLAEIFSTDIDFHRDLRKGDKFSLVYESLTHNGQHIRSGRVLAAEFVNSNKRFEAYWFETAEGKGGYFTADGKSLRKAFLRSPLEFSRVTSGFSNARFHPVLQVTRAHKGIDYGAPTGTRVRTVADGTVEFAGRQGGYGNLIVIKHQGAYSTAYGHLNGIAQGIKKGARVSQGDTIGYVGQTGVATGPHLHYEFRVNSQQINPMTASLPTALPLDASQKPRFRIAMESLRSHLELIQQTALASVE